MSAAYLQAAVPEPFRVLGRDLKPYTLGHQILLEYFASGFAIGSDKEPTYEDLLISVFVCSYTFDDAVKELNSRGIRWKIKAWSLLCGKFDIWEAMSYFRRYIEAHSQEPRFWVIEKTGKSPRSDIPFVQFLKVKLQQELGYTEEHAINTPYQVAVWNYLTVLEGKGMIRFYSPGDELAEKAANDPVIAEKLRVLAERMHAGGVR